MAQRRANRRAAVDEAPEEREPLGRDDVEALAEDDPQSLDDDVDDADFQDDLDDADFEDEEAQEDEPGPAKEEAKEDRRTARRGRRPVRRAPRQADRAPRPAARASRHQGRDSRQQDQDSRQQDQDSRQQDQDSRQQDRDSAPDGRGPRGTGGSDSALTIREAATSALREIAELTGKHVESVTGAERTEDGWLIDIEVVEDRRIPSSTDLLATYEAALNADGDLVSYRRVRRYTRGRGGDGEES